MLSKFLEIASKVLNHSPPGPTVHLEICHQENRIEQLSDESKLHCRCHAQKFGTVSVIGSMKVKSSKNAHGQT